uniref:Kunitz protease inhibitor-related protein n=1 Tax=Culicoides sonorensis TaxID=179676 RepID=Q66TW5_CULSO|nr:kunitz protease inhibitor-related protein [Culicoides sonorensis]
MITFKMNLKFAIIFFILSQISMISTQEPKKPLWLPSSCRKIESTNDCKNPSYVYNRQSNKCESGCGVYNFGSLKDCTRSCERNYLESMRKSHKTKRCFLEYRQGSGNEGLEKFYYDFQEKKCKKFDYLGGIVLEYPFNTMIHCQNTCESPINSYLDLAEKNANDRLQ